jgi:hypothetical protein
MPPPNEQNGDRPSNVTSWLVIPYFEGDIGRVGSERPLPAGKGTSWLCPSIIVDGQPGGTKFKRGRPISIEVDVANWGSGVLPAAALMRLWWADPTLAFSVATLFAQTTVPVPPTGIPVRAGTFPVTIPTGASPHVCLLVQVSAPLDGASGVPNPYQDRHWAQLNLVETGALAADGTYALPIALGNPHAFVARSRLTLSAMSAEEARLLTSMRGFDIRTDGRAELMDDGARTIDLPPESARQVVVALRFGDRAVGGQRQGYVLTQHLSRPERGERPILTGTLGLLVGGGED